VRITLQDIGIDDESAGRLSASVSRCRLMSRRPHSHPPHHGRDRAQVASQEHRSGGFGRQPDQPVTGRAADEIVPGEVVDHAAPDEARG
jgi:hypothetical protein